MQSSHDSKDGNFDLYCHKGRVYVVVRGPGAHGSPVYPDQIESRLRLLGAPRVPSSRIRSAIDEAAGKPVPLIDWPEGRRLEAEFEVQIAEDRMSAELTIKAPHKGGAVPSRDDALEALDEAGVVFGVDFSNIDQMIEAHNYSTPVVVATGREPVYGSGHRIKYHFNTSRGKPYLELEFDRINLKELNFIDNRHEDELLAELLPPIRAEDGRTVTGETIPAQTDVVVVRLQAGRNTYLSRDERHLYAGCDGNVRILEDGTVIVEPVVTVKNVNYETGNIHFEGSVVVEGNIADNFIIEADGDIQVGKGVGKATLRAGGNIVLKTGINGNADGAIECGGDLYARYVESARVTCRGHAFVEEAIMHSHMVVAHHCLLNGRRSEIIASTLIVGGSVWCKKLGNFNEAATRVAIGVAPELLMGYRSAKKALEDKQAELDRIEEKLAQLEKALRDGRNDGRLLQAREQLQAAGATVVKDIDELRKRLPAMREEMRASRKSILVVEDTLFRGVSLSFGSMEYRVPDNGVRKTIFRPGESEILESGFDVRNKPRLEFTKAASAHGTP
ncbi:MAG: FapA family protein [Spirochaetia bacterium]